MSQPPIQNLRVMAYLRERYEQSEEGTFEWSRHWIETGFEAYEASVAKDRRTGAYSHGERPTMDKELKPPVGVGQRSVSVSTTQHDDIEIAEQVAPISGS